MATVASIATPQGLIDRFGFSTKPLNKSTDADLIAVLQQAISETYDVLTLDPAFSTISSSGTEQQKRVLAALIELRAACLVLMRPRTQKVLGTYYPLQFEDSASFEELCDHVLEVAATYQAILLGSVPSEVGAQGGTSHGFCDPGEASCPILVTTQTEW